MLCKIGEPGTPNVPKDFKHGNLFLLPKKGSGLAEDTRPITDYHGHLYMASKHLDKLSLGIQILQDFTKVSGLHHNTHKTAILYPS